MLDGVAVGGTGAAARLWHVVRQVGAFSVRGVAVVTRYPLPGVAVTALGFALGPLFDSDPSFPAGFVHTLPATYLVWLPVLALS